VKRLLAVVAGLALALVATMAVAAWLSSGSGTASATATTVDKANAPGATPVASTVSLSWATSTLASGDAVTGYQVYRHVGPTAELICTVTSSSCVDTAPVATQVSYGVVATIGAHWRGPESDLTPFTYDDVAPTTTADVTPAPNAAGWNKAPGTVTVSLEADDSGSTPNAGVDHISYTLDGGSAVVVPAASTSFTVSGAGTHTVGYFAVDNAGNTEAAQTLTVKIDPDAPVTTVVQNPLANANGWNHDSVTLDFSATDSGTSGIKSVTVEGVGTAGATATATLTAEGTHTVSYFATDNADNVEGTKTATVKIDKTAPTASIIPVGGSSWTNDNTVALTAGDALSGIASTQYSLDGATLQDYTGPVTLADGTRSFRYVVTDLAGNTLDQTASIKVDTVTPTSSIASTTSTTWTITASDAAPSSGVSIEWWLDSDAHSTTSGTSAVVPVPTGSHTIHWFAKDAAGNQQTQQDLAVTVSTADTIAPTVSMTYPTVINPIINNGQWTNSGCSPQGKPAGLCGTASDNVGVVGSAQFELRRIAVSPNTCWNGTSFTAAACGSYQTAGGTAASWQIALPYASLPSGTFELRVKVSDAAGNTNRSGTVPAGTSDLSFTK
jgi:hypothetical protein